MEDNVLSESGEDTQHDKTITAVAEPDGAYLVKVTVFSPQVSITQYRNLHFFALFGTSQDPHQQITLALGGGTKWLHTVYTATPL